jgi:ADP-heptose:LPS heptosyltransferase
MKTPVLVHLGSGIGNIVLATPLLVALHRLGATVDVCLSADYPETADLLREWVLVRTVVQCPDLTRYEAVIPAVPPFYWRAFASMYHGRPRIVARPPDALFYTDEQEYYLSFARALGFAGTRPCYTLPVGPSDRYGVRASTVVLAPGCKTGKMAAKRWARFPELAAQLDDVAVVGTREDLIRFDGTEMRFEPHVPSFVGRLTLRETAEMLASAGVVVANDSGLGHVAAAVGTPTLMIFGPTPHATLGRFPPNVRIVRAGLPCEPCWFGGDRFRACESRIDCLRAISVDLVVHEVVALMNPSAIPARYAPTGSSDAQRGSRPEVGR